MDRYFFHFHDGTDQPDHTGTELASAQAARDAAVVFKGEKLKDSEGSFLAGRRMVHPRRGCDRRGGLRHPGQWQLVD